jgi:hypothetical protein
MRGHHHYGLPVFFPLHTQRAEQGTQATWLFVKTEKLFLENIQEINSYIFFFEKIKKGI